MHACTYNYYNTYLRTFDLYLFLLLHNIFKDDHDEKTEGRAIRIITLHADPQWPQPTLQEWEKTLQNAMTALREDTSAATSPDKTMPAIAEVVGASASAASPATPVGVAAATPAGATPPAAAALLEHIDHDQLKAFIGSGPPKTPGSGGGTPPLGGGGTPPLSKGPGGPTPPFGSARPSPPGGTLNTPQPGAADAQPVVSPASSKHDAAELALRELHGLPPARKVNAVSSPHGTRSQHTDAELALRELHGAPPPRKPIKNVSPTAKHEDAAELALLGDAAELALREQHGAPPPHKALVALINEHPGEHVDHDQWKDFIGNGPPKTPGGGGGTPPLGGGTPPLS